ncbi:hypothetical protein Tco_0153365 [Tanacetum coccineum]
MIESEKPLKKKDQIMYDQKVALNLQSELQAKLEEEERFTRQKEEEANIALIESWDNTQAMMDVDYQMAPQLQAEEQEQLSIEEKSKLFVQLLEDRKKHFAEIRAREKRNKPPTQFEVIKDMFNKAFKRVNTFVDYKTKLVEGSKKRAEDSTKRAGTKLEQEVAKKQKVDDAKVDDDQEEARMKELMNIVPDEEEVEINAIPLATKPTCIVDWKIIKEGKISQFHIIRADESSKSTLSDVAIYAYLYAGREKGRIVGIKSFIRLFGITAALIKVCAAQEESTARLMLLVYKLLLLVFRVNAAGIKLQLLTELHLLMDKD